MKVKIIVNRNRRANTARLFFIFEEAGREIDGAVLTVRAISRERLEVLKRLKEADEIEVIYADEEGQKAQGERRE